MFDTVIPTERLDNRGSTSSKTQQNVSGLQVLSHVGFQVSEEGAEDPAGPVVDMVPLKFVVNRPFFFAVVEENSNAILLLGRITNPSL